MLPHNGNSIKSTQRFAGDCNIVGYAVRIHYVLLFLVLIWDGGARCLHYNTKQQSLRETLLAGEKNVQHRPLVDHAKFFYLLYISISV